MMLCTNCSKVLKPVVAVDIDGTIGDYHGHFLSFAEGYLNDKGNDTIPGYDGRSSSFKNWFCMKFDTDQATFREIKLAYRQGGMKRTMPKYDYATGMIESFREAEAEVWITTTRPYMRLDNIDPDTREWLRRNGINYDGLIYDKAKYAMLASRVDPQRVVGVIEDLPDKVVEAEKFFGWDKVFWRRTPYNEGLGAGGNKSLVIIAREILKQIDTWKEEND